MKKIDRVYQVKYEKKVKDLLEAGFELIPPEVSQRENSVCKIVKMPKDSDPVKYFTEVYNNELWQKNHLTNELDKKVYESLGIQFEDILDEKTGFNKKVVVENEAFLEMATTWYIQIDMDEDRWLSFTAAGVFFDHEFCNKNILDLYCKEEIDKLFELGLIKIVDIENGGNKDNVI